MAEATLKRGSARRSVVESRPRGATTPGRLRRFSIVIATVAILLSVIGVTAVVMADVTATGIQQRAVPEIVGMQRINAWLSDADRSAANAYLAGGFQVTLSQQQYEADIAAASRELQKASELDPGGDVASRRLQAIAVAVDQYAGLVQTASVEYRLSQAGSSMPNLATTGTVYLRAGSALMHRPKDGILAQVTALRDFYAADLDRANLTLKVTAIMSVAYAIVATVLLGVLIRTQLFLRIRFRRRRNNQLLAATLLLLIVSAGSAIGGVQAAQSIRVAQDQYYVRLLNVWNARALMYDLNGNESLSLIAQSGGGAQAQFDQAFKQVTARLVDKPLTTQLVSDADHGQVAFGGLLADELRSAGSDQELATARTALHAYQRFLAVDAQLRSTAQAANKFQAEGNQALADSNQKAAVALALGTNANQLVFAFNELDWDLGVITQILQDQFDQSMMTGERVLAATAGLEVLIVAVAGLAFWGLQPRIAEYTAGGRRQQAVPGTAAARS